MLDFSTLPRFKEKSTEIFELIPEWCVAYGVTSDAIIRQIQIAHAWCNANKKKAPRVDVVRFLWNWMQRAKQYGNLESRKPQEKKATEKETDLTYEEMVEIRRRNMNQTIVNGRNMKDAIDTEVI